MPYPGWSPKQIRQYKHILENTGDKSIAAGVVNKQRSEKGLTKKRKKSRRAAG